MSEWLKMESIYQLVFETKCWRRAEMEYPSPRGIECPKSTKHVPGIFCLFIVIITMWFPFLLFALFDTVAQANVPLSATIEVDFGTLGKVYKTESSHENVIPFTSAQYDSFQSIYKDHRKAWTYLSNYGRDDVAVLKFEVRPIEPWQILPHALERLNKTIQNATEELRISLSWKVERTDRTQIVATPSNSIGVVIKGKSREKEQLKDALKGKGNEIVLENMLPKFIQINNEGKAQAISGFFGFNNTGVYRNISLKLNISAKTGSSKWWELRESNQEAFGKSKLNQLPHQNPSSLIIYTFNEKNVPKLLVYISKRGIIGLYVSFVLVTWTMLKRFMTMYPAIMFDDMPNMNPVLQLCHDIYLARESHEFALEEDLYAKLLFLFRSPETMIQWTRLPLQGRSTATED